MASLFSVTYTLMSATLPVMMCSIMGYRRPFQRDFTQLCASELIQNHHRHTHIVDLSASYDAPSFSCDLIHVFQRIIRKLLQSVSLHESILIMTGKPLYELQRQGSRIHDLIFDCTGEGQIQ